MLRSIALAAVLGLSACSAGNDQPGTITADEARQLNEAAAMLDANSVEAALPVDTHSTNTQDDTAP